jgi:hypothetical protein
MIVSHLLLLSLRQLDVENRLDVAYLLRPLPCPFAPWNAIAVDDLAGTPAAPRAPI